MRITNLSIVSLLALTLTTGCSSSSGDSPWETCGDYINFGGQSYPTVQIGTQCWFAENLNTGTQISTSTTQNTDCSNVEKYCYDNDSNNCDSYGGLYTWPQAMCGASVESSQGICPTGWHIPSSPEYAIAVNNLADSNFMPDYGSGNPFQVWYASPAGDRLKSAGLCQGRTPCADSGFDVLMNGEAYVDTGNWVFVNLDATANFWTSSNNANEAYRICLSEDNSGVCNTFFYSDYNEHAFAIRCVKD